MVQPKNKAALSLWRWLILLPLPLLWCVAAHYGALTFLEDRSLDWRFRFRGEIDAPVKVVYVDIDSQSLSEIGGFPWSRMYFARVASALVERAGARAIGVDIVFSENGVAESIDWKKRVAGNREFAQFLIKNPPLVLAASYAAAADRDINGHFVHRELPLINRPRQPGTIDLPEAPSFRISETDLRRQWSPGLIGLIDTIDGGARTVPAFALTSVRSYWHMAVELARLHYGIAPDGVKRTADHIDLVRADGTLARRIPLRAGQLIDVNWFSAWTSPLRNPRVGFSTVFNYAEMLSSEKPEERKAAEEFFADPEFKDAIVLIGPVDPLLQDLATTPFDEVPAPKVGVHGNLLKTIVSGAFLRRLPAWGGVAWSDYAIVLGLTLAVCGLATTGGARSVLTKGVAAILLAGYAGLAFWVFKSHHAVLPLAAPLGAAFTTSFAGVIWQLIEEEKQKGRIKGLFGTYLSPTVVNAMVESGKDPELGGHDAEITAYFSDIQGFSSFAEVMTSARLAELLNEYLTACTDIVQAEGGSLDKYIGDAVVAMYGAPIEAPDHAFRACVASQLVQKRIGELRAKWKAEGAAWPPLVQELRTRIGLHTGVCMIGNMGSRTRFNYTMMGDNVNLAARMESGAKSWGVYTMCSETTKVACEQHGGDRVVFRALGRIVVKGRTQAVPIYEIAGLKEDVAQRTRDGIRAFEQGLARYYARDWNGARVLFEHSRELEVNVPGQTPGVVTNPSLVYLEIAEQCRREPPPESWDGAYVMVEK